MSESIVGKKSFEFAIKIVCFYKKFSIEKKEFVMSKQSFLEFHLTLCNSIK